MFYAAGSLLFAFVLVAASSVIAHQLRVYRQPMMRALRGLRLDSVHRPNAPAPQARGAVLSYRPATVPARRRALAG
jgi:hypothetical protein